MPLYLAAPRIGMQGHGGRRVRPAGAHIGDASGRLVYAETSWWCRLGLGIPVGYGIELSRDRATWDTVASMPEFPITLRWDHVQQRMDRSGRVVSRFVPRPVRYIRVTQTGARSDRWWGIAEIFVHGPTGAEVPHRDDASARLREGARLEAAGRFGPALAAYQEAVRLEPELEEAHWRTVETYGNAGLPLEGTDPYRRGLVFEELGLWARAARQYEMLRSPAAEDGQHSELLDRLREIYRRLGDGEGTARVERRLWEEYSPSTRAEATFGRFARLLGYDVDVREPYAGQTVELTYYWQALNPVAEDFAVVVHFVRDGKTAFGQDHQPLDGAYPTSRWRQGERVRERYRVRLPDDLPAGEYEIRIGLWNAKTRKRLPVSTALPRLGDRVRLTTLRVLARP